MKLHNQIKEALENLDNLEILYIDEVNEAKVKNTKAGGSIEKNNNLYFSPSATNDPAPFNRLTAAGPGTRGTMGGYVRSALSALGAGYGVQVADFGEVCTINVTYSNAQTGRVTGQNFAIIFRGPNSKYAYTAYSTSAKWRNCNGVDQAVSFIRSKISAMSGTTSSSL